MTQKSDPHIKLFVGVLKGAWADLHRIWCFFLVRGRPRNHTFPSSLHTNFKKMVQISYSVSESQWLKV